MQRLFINGIQIDAAVSFQIADVEAHSPFFFRHLIQFILTHGVDACRIVTDYIGKFVHAVLPVVLQLIGRLDHIKGNLLFFH